MQSFPVLTIDTAPEKSRPALEALQGAFGMIPNVAGTMATSAVLIDSLVALFGKVHGGSFTEAQVQTLLLANAVTNGCAWAVAFHTGLALKEGLDKADVQAIRERRAPKDVTSAALSTFATTLIEKRGRVDDRDVDKFMAAAEKCHPDIIGMSALLTTTMMYMKTVIDGFQAAGQGQIKMAIGGAPISQMFADEIGADGYGQNASAAVDLFLKLAKQS